MMRILVIGGTGFFASHIVSELLARNDEVIVVARGQTAPVYRTPDWDRVRMIHLDRDAAETSGEWQQQIGSLEVDAIIDVAAHRMESARLIFRMFNGRIRRYLYYGTISIYGAGSGSPIRETDPLAPVSPYAQQKLQVHNYLMERSAQECFPVTILNPSTIAGAGHPILTPRGDFDQSVFRDIASGEPLIFPGTGQEMVQLVHPKDVARAFLLALDKPGQSMGQVFNVSADRSLTFNEYLHLIADMLHVEPNVTYIPLDAWQARFGANPTVVEHLAQHSPIDIGKSRQMLGYEPTYDATRIVGEVLTWLVDTNQVDLLLLEK
jgi:nucleoside-diphosphate-sugar epimerase